MDTKLEVVKLRFMNRLVKTPYCWNWKGARVARMGYGQMLWCGKRWYAHRLSWRIHYGIIPDNMHVLHKCDNPICVNPDHLFLGTHQDNMDDMNNKNRGKHLCGEQNGYSKLTQEQVDGIRSSSLSYRILASKYGVSKSTIFFIKKHKTWAKRKGQTV